MHEDPTTVTTGTRPAQGQPPTAPPRRSMTAILPLVALAGIAATAVFLGSRPAVPPTVVDHLSSVPLPPGTVDPLPSWNAGPTKQTILTKESPVNGTFTSVALLLSSSVDVDRGQLVR